MLTSTLLLSLGGLNMKWLTTQKWLVLCLGFLLVIGQGSLFPVQAQPEEEEEEEEIQTRPNPMDKTTLKGREGLSLKGAPVGWDPGEKNPAMQQNKMAPKAGKAISNKVQSGAASGQAVHPGAAMEQGK